MSNARSSNFFSIVLIAGTFASSQALASVRASDLGPVDPKYLHRYWLTPGAKEISANRVEQVFRIFKEDPEANALLMDITKRFGATDPMDLAKLIQLCPDLPANSAAAVGITTAFNAQLTLP